MISLPQQAPDVSWPTTRWPTAPPAAAVDRARLDDALGRIFDEASAGELGTTHAVVAIHRGRLVLERYARALGPQSSLHSWSMAKSILHAVVGILVRDGALRLHESIGAPEWRAPSDLRREITLDQLLRMSSGLEFNEDYVDGETSHCIDMLFGSGRADVAAYAASLPLIHSPDQRFNYSSGTSNIIARVAGRAVGGGREGMVGFLRRELFGPLGMQSATPSFDDAGTWIGSSYVYATARDFARFGLLYLRDGVWDGKRILPPGWVTLARTRTPASPDDEPYGSHWWLTPGGQLGTFYCSGYRTQRILVVPALDLIVVRLGHTPIELAPNLLAQLGEVVRAFLPTLRD